MESILFVCVGNACRSQMAEGFARHLGPPGLVVHSAGSNPAGFIAPGAIEAMKEKGIDISRHYSKGISDLPKIKFDYIVTMGCGDVCPTLPMESDSGERIDWEIPDPVGRSPEFFRQVRDEIKAKVEGLISEGRRSPPSHQKF
ncbi:MAG: arsenate reductase ArsC [Deltaproteobacteria bacterium]|nr:arsenate reductase ArsC [Deltaproteobacteria bacterium]MBI4374039.1 arsenate reductase ArsC [Deltaproteobacteria bacterium]